MIEGFDAHQTTFFYLGIEIGLMGVTLHSAVLPENTAKKDNIRMLKMTSLPPLLQQALRGAQGLIIDREAVREFFAKVRDLAKARRNSLDNGVEEGRQATVRKGHALAVFDEFKELIQIRLLTKITNDECPPASFSAVSADAEALAELSKDLVKAVKIKVNPECPLCLDDIPSGQVAHCGHRYGGAKHLFHLNCAQNLAVADRNLRRAHRCPTCRIQMLRGFHLAELNGEDVLDLPNQYTSARPPPVPPRPYTSEEKIEVCLLLMALTLLSVVAYMKYLTSLDDETGVSARFTLSIAGAFPVVLVTVPSVYAMIYVWWGVLRLGSELFL